MKPILENYKLEDAPESWAKFEVPNYEVEFGFDGVTLVALGSWFEADDEDPCHIAVFGEDEELTIPELMGLLDSRWTPSSLKRALLSVAEKALREDYWNEKNSYPRRYLM